MGFKGSLLALSTALTFCFGCGSGDKSPETVRQETAASAPSDGAQTASLVSKSVLQSANIVDAEGHAATLKLDEAAADAICPSPIDQTLTVNDGTLHIQGACVSETAPGGCIYRFDGLLTFHSFVLSPKKVLDGGLNVILTATSPTCSLGDGTATVQLDASGLAFDPLELNGAVFETLSAALSLDATVASLQYRSRIDDFVCLSTKDSAACFNDRDRDLVDDTKDNCPGIANLSQSDTDGDGIGDLCDNCPVTANSDQADSDGDAQGDACLHICAPGVSLCETPDDCGSGLGCIHGCCQACPNTQFIAMTCQQAEDINDATGVTVEDSCDPFGHVCNTDNGCCEFKELGDPFNLCGDACGVGPEGTLDLCTNLFQAAVCVTPRCPALTDVFGNSTFFGFDCSTDGQVVCDQLIGSGLVGFGTTCQSGCCADGTSP